MNKTLLEGICRELLEEIGEDPDREGLRGTPARWARWWMDFIEYDPGNTDTVFEQISADQLVIVRGLRVWSLCEHHLLPFWTDLSIGYVPAGRVLGLSKLARIAQEAAHRLQVQERMVRQIADRVSAATGSADVAVTGTGQHLCMIMRGVRMSGEYVTSDLRGVFRDDARTRAEFTAACGV